MEREHPLAGMFVPMSPERLERVIALATEEYAAMTPAEVRRERRAERRERLRSRVRRFLSL